MPEPVRVGGRPCIENQNRKPECRKARYYSGAEKARYVYALFLCARPYRENTIRRQFAGIAQY